MPLNVKCNGCHTPASCKEAGFCWNARVNETRYHEAAERSRANPRPVRFITPGSTGPTGTASDPLTVGAGAPEPVGVPCPPPAPQRAASTPRAPAGEGGRPAPTGATGRVWVIADRLRAEAGCNPPFEKGFRRSVIEACEKDGINPSTASVQFSKWASSQLTA